LKIEDLEVYTLQELEILASYIQYKYDHVSDPVIRDKCEDELQMLLIAMVVRRLFKWSVTIA